VFVNCNKPKHKLVGGKAGIHFYSTDQTAKLKFFKSDVGNLVQFKIPYFCFVLIKATANFF